MTIDERFIEYLEGIELNSPNAQLIGMYMIRRMKSQTETGLELYERTYKDHKEKYAVWLSENYSADA